MPDGGMARQAAVISHASETNERDAKPPPVGPLRSAALRRRGSPPAGLAARWTPPSVGGCAVRADGAVTGRASRRGAGLAAVCVSVCPVCLRFALALPRARVEAQSEKADTPDTQTHSGAGSAHESRENYGRDTGRRVPPCAHSTPTEKHYGRSPPRCIARKPDRGEAHRAAAAGLAMSGDGVAPGCGQPA